MAKFNIDEVRRHVEALIANNPDLADDEVLRADMLEGETELRAALEWLALRKVETDKLVDGLTALLTDFKERKARLEDRVTGLREIMLKLLQSADLKRVELPVATLSQGNRPQQIVGDVDGDALPDDLVRIRREPNRTAIREALENHRYLPGLSLSNAPPGLNMKVK